MDKTQLKSQTERKKSTQGIMQISHFCWLLTTTVVIISSNCRIMSPLFQGETLFLNFPSVCHKILRALLLLYGLLDRLEPLYNASLPFVDVHIFGAGGSNYFLLSYSGSNRGGGCKKSCERFSSYMAYWTNLSLCTMLHCHL